MISDLVQLKECEELLKHATDIIERLPEDEDTTWVLDKTNEYFKGYRVYNRK